MSPPPVPTPAESPWPSESPAPGGRSRALRQAVGRGTGLVLLAAALVAAAGSWRLIDVALDGPVANTAQRGLERALRERGWAVGPPVPSEHRVFGPSQLRGRPHAQLELLEHLLEDETGRALEGHTVRARGELALLDSAEPAASPVVTVDAASPLLVIKDTGSWLLVAVKKDERTLLGWAPRESIVTLP
jgi:hypothetical protein